jgi:prevent-host-death family protein
MDTTAVADLKARLSKYLRRVKNGHEVLVTERGVPIAKIVPLTSSAQRSTRRERLIKAGVIVPGRGPLPKFLLEPPTGDPSIGAEVLKELLAERREGR